MRLSWLSWILWAIVSVVIYSIPIVIRFLVPGQLPPSSPILFLVAWGVVFVAAQSLWRDYLQYRAIANEQKKYIIEVALQEFIVQRLNMPGRVRASIFQMGYRSRKLSISYEHGIEGSPDSRLSFEPLRGWVGYVWDRKKSAHWDLSTHDEKETLEKWAFTEGQYRAIQQAGVKSVLYTPIFHPDQPDNIIGVLGVDSTEPMSQTHLSTKRLKKELAKSAATLGMLLVDKRQR